MSGQDQKQASTAGLPPQRGFLLSKSGQRLVPSPARAPLVTCAKMQDEPEPLF